MAAIPSIASSFPTGADERTVTVQLEGGRTREFIWRDTFGFYPAGTHARVATSAATSLQILWSPDPEAAGSLDVLVPFEDPFIQANLHVIAGELATDAPDRLLVECVGNAVLLKLMRHFGGRRFDVPRAQGLSQERMRRVIDYIDSHLGEDLTLDTLAGIACLSPHHLSRSFHRAAGVGLHRFVVQRRVDRAKHLVLGSDLSMAEIAWRVWPGSQLPSLSGPAADLGAGAQLAAQFSNAELRQIREARLLVPLDQPESVAEAILDLVEQRMRQ